MSETYRTITTLYLQEEGGNPDERIILTPGALLEFDGESSVKGSDTFTIQNEDGNKGKKVLVSRVTYSPVRMYNVMTRIS